MAESRIQFTPGDIAALSTSTVFAFVAGGLTFIVEFGHDEALIPLFYPLMPGLIAGLIITGGHGGTVAQERAASWIAALVNAIFYFVLIILVVAAKRRFAGHLTSTH